MVAANKRYLLMITAAAGAAIVAGGWAAAGKPSPGKRSAPDAAAEARILSVLGDMYEHQRKGMMNVTPADGRLLRVLTEAVGAGHVVEIGTSNGYSTIWFCLALRGTGGKITTYEINAHRASLARENFKRAGVDSLVTLVEGDAHQEVLKLTDPIDILFLDADKAGYIDYLDKLLPRVRPGGLILAHNTTDLGSMMRDYIKAVTTNPDLETIFLHQHDRGIGVTLKKRPMKAGASVQAPREAILGYIKDIPKESAQRAKERHRLVARKRASHPLIFHRGAVRRAPENTLECYAAAIDMGADGVEIDIHRTKDGVLVLHHDDTLGRTFEGHGKIRDKTYYELLQAKLKERKGPVDEDTRLPTLAAFLELARERAILIHLDVKQSGIQDDIIKMIEEADVWDHLVEVNGGNADKIRPDTWNKGKPGPHNKVKLIPYAQNVPLWDGPIEDVRKAIQDYIRKQEAESDRDYMFFGGREHQERLAKIVGHKPVEKALPLPGELRAEWTAAGIASAGGHMTPR